ncbi:MFS transporter [Novosphingobium sp. KCTC 2891]|uniref:MFS transporter n=1 Tax=Novosphingobium sp. KCTC 2891 TaxID=2989730 RepID=UPI0022229514|nr:MFS transporter [Novosphingobium sp. KCTC 2891]MCW1385025.1 MFS transporter [Novosphingobium sp. KCTC 2891]
MSLAFGSFGPLLAANEAHFGVDRTEISLGMSVLTTALGLSAIVGGGTMHRFRPSTVMIAGALANLVAYLGLMVSGAFPFALAMFALVGVGTTLTAILGPVTIVARLFPDRRGRVLSLVNLPLMMFVVPYMVARGLPVFGREYIYAAAAVAFAVLLPLLCLLQSDGGSDKQAGPTIDDSHVIPAGEMFARLDFWLVALGIGLIAGTGTAFTVHSTAFAQSYGLDPASAAMLLSVYSGAGIAGTLVMGWLADRIGPRFALAIAGAIQAIGWALLASGATALFLPVAAMLGVVTVPLVTLHGAAMAAMFGSASVSRAMGVSYALKLPFLFGITPLVGWAYVHFGNYRIALAGSALALFLATLLFVLPTRSRREAAVRGPAFQG